MFANAQTGNIVLLSTHLFEGDWGQALRYLVPVLAFLLGIYIAECVHRHFKRMEKRTLAAAYHSGGDRTAGGSGLPAGNAEHHRQRRGVASCAPCRCRPSRKVRGHAYASTMCIGNMRSGTEALCAYFHTRDKEILHKALTYFGVVLLFALGAGVGSTATLHWGAGTIWLSCGLLTVSFLIMFIHDEEQKLNE